MLKFSWTIIPGFPIGVELLELRPGDRVLELGCGDGRNLEAMQRGGVDVVGVDYDASTIGDAVPSGSRRLVVADAAGNLPIKDATIGAAFSIFGAMSFDDPGAVLTEVRRVLQPGRVFVFSIRDPTWDFKTKCQSKNLSVERNVDSRPPYDYVVAAERLGFSDIRILWAQSNAEDIACCLGISLGNAQQLERIPHTQIIRTRCLRS